MKELLPDWALAALEADDALDEAALGDALATLSRLIPAEAPAANRRAELFAELEGHQRYAPFTSRLAKLFDLDEPAVDALLPQTVGPDWQAFPIPGVELLHLDGGPATAGADVGLVRLAPGASFPLHRHLGHETALILEGGYTDSAGRGYHAGDVAEMEVDTEHDFTAGPEGCVFAVVVFGVEINGVRLGEH
ncbi:MAG: cupin domain-containing protein [Polyangiaceae bacterium]|nr:cupin domain-containing protein [Myxococcales bacterium]MCB9586257.1 cupin domain-containing protein [Polyangiaceae bacterium]